MQIIVSLFNSSPETPNIWIFDDSLKYIASFAKGFKDVKGLYCDDKYIYAGHRDENNDCWCLIFSKQNFELFKKYRLTGTRRIHSIRVEDNSLFAVSSGTNQLIIYPFNINISENELIPKKIIFTPLTDINSEDIIHLNSLSRDNSGSLCISGFGKKDDGKRWAEADNGFIFNLDKGEFTAKGIYHPHSLCFQDNNYWICESKKKTVLKNNEVVISNAIGFTRGLYVYQLEKFLFVGTSTSRVYENVIVDENTSGVHMYSHNGKKYVVEKSFFFDDKYAEVYDVIRL